MTCSDEKIFPTRSSYVIVGGKQPTTLSKAVNTTPFIEEESIDIASSMKTISISISLARKSDEEIRFGSCRIR